MLRVALVEGVEDLLEAVHGIAHHNKNLQARYSRQYVMYAAACKEAWVLEAQRTAHARRGLHQGIEGVYLTLLWQDAVVSEEEIVFLAAREKDLRVLHQVLL